jgi:sterol desaturase/sphingolipid hydroxylase (fatty acid hydroxylase superfamily)
VFAETLLTSLIGTFSYLLVGVGLFLPLELVFPKARATFAQRASGILFLLALAPIIAVVAACFTAIKTALSIEPLLHFHYGMGGPIIAAIGLALWLDLQFYVVHRLEHRFLWRFHAVHHSIRHLSAANSYHHWTEPLWTTLLVSIPLLFIDVQIGPTLAALSFLFRYQQFYIHSASRPHFGPFRLLLIDNRYHRIHHSMEPTHHHKNFGAMTPLWDWLFGTLYMPKSDEWPEVGLKEAGEPQSLREWSALPWSHKPRLEYPHIDKGGVNGGGGEVLGRHVNAAGRV